MTILKEILKSAAGIGLMFIIINGIVSNGQRKGKIMANLITGFFLMSLFAVCLLIDFNRKYFLRNIFFLGFSFIYMLIYLLYHSRLDFFSSNRNRESRLYFKEYLYIVYRNNNNLYGLKGKTGYYHGLSVFASKRSFHEDIITRINRKYTVEPDGDFIKTGEIILYDKKKIFHCFLINARSVGPLLETMDIRCVDGYSMEEFDRDIIFRLIINDKFVITKGENNEGATDN